MYTKNLSYEEIKKEVLEGLIIKGNNIIENDFDDELYRVNFHLYIRRSNALNDKDTKCVEQTQLLMDVLSLRYSLYKIDTTSIKDKNHKARLVNLRENYEKQLIDKLSKL